jgi:hypothetical protein
LFNIALLSKWKWRFLTDGEAIWSDLLRFRYGHLPSAVLRDEPILQGTKASTWWKDVIGIGRGTDVNWFGENIGCSLQENLVLLTEFFEGLKPSINY